MGVARHMGAKFVAAIIGVIILVVLAQTFVFGGGDDDAPSVNNPSSIPTATPPAQPSDPVLLGEGNASEGSSGSASGGTSSQTTYTVQSGDTLGAIASQLGVAPEDQAAWIQQVLDLNGMEDARQLQAGQELILPGVPQSASSSNESSDSSDNAQTDDSGTEPTPPPSATGTLPTATPGSGGGSASTYVVQDGDTPFGIALKHCVADPDGWVAELLDINAVDANSLSIGQELDLPPGTPALCDDGTSSEEDDG